MKRSAALGAVLGPATFVACWSALGTASRGYSPIREPISRLAAATAPTRVPMSFGILTLGAGLWAFGIGLRESHPAAGIAARISAVASVGIAMTPLDTPVGGSPHAAAAGVAYASLAAIPALVARDRRRRGEPFARTAAVSGVTALALGLSVLGGPGTGAWQRIGLTAGHAWIAASGVRALLGPLARAGGSP